MQLGMTIVAIICVGMKKVSRDDWGVNRIRSSGEAATFKVGMSWCFLVFLGPGARTNRKAGHRQPAFWKQIAHVSVSVSHRKNLRTLFDLWSSIVYATSA